MEMNAEIERLRSEILRLQKWIDRDSDDELLRENERLRAQLPAGMQHCTIIFKECEKGHGRLTAANWIDHGCQQCEIERLRALLDDPTYIRCKADYLRGHLSHANYLNEKERNLKPPAE